MSGRITSWRWRRGYGGLPQRKPEHVDDYTGVLIPLDQAHLHSHSARCGRTEYEELPGDEEEDGDEDPKDRVLGGADGDEDMGMLEMSAAEYSIQGLRKEVRKGSGGTRSVYESKSSQRLVHTQCFGSWANGNKKVKSMLINKAVQDIGMGKYNWQLFILCGFGWFADKYVPSLLFFPLPLYFLVIQTS